MVKLKLQNVGKVAAATVLAWLLGTVLAIFADKNFDDALEAAGFEYLGLCSLAVYLLLFTCVGALAWQFRASSQDLVLGAIAASIVLMLLNVQQYGIGAVDFFSALLVIGSELAGYYAYRYYRERRR